MKVRRMLPIIFGDDEHTAVDGPYKRVLATRKWLYILSTLSIVVTLGFYDASSTTSLVKVVRLPTDLVSPALMIGISYLVIQYTLLAWQLCTTYDIVLKDRFILRKADELSSARIRMLDSKRELDSLASEAKIYGNYMFDERENALSTSLSEKDNSLAEAEAELSKLKSYGASQDKQAAAEGVKAGRQRERNNVATALLRLRDDKMSYVDAKYKMRLSSASLVFSKSEKSFVELQKQEPSERMGYQLSERIIDVSRILAPYILAVIALFRYWGR